jgi:hypothetical protein
LNNGLRKKAMKKLIVLIILLYTKSMFSQETIQELLDRKNAVSINYEITSYDLVIVQNSYTISYSQNNYNRFQPDLSFHNNVLQTLQARYDYNYNRVSGEYTRLWHLELINETNKAIFKDYKDVISRNVDTKDVNWGIDANADAWITYITQPFNVESIKNEIKLLQKINAEINRIKRTDPDNFYKSKRYTEMAEVLNKLKSCSISEISNIAWKYGLI